MYNKNVKKTFEMLRSEITFFNEPVHNNQQQYTTSRYLPI